MNMMRANSDQGQERLKGRGPAFQTVSGKLLYLLDPAIEDIDIYDIAIGLSKQCRFNGQLPDFYSVAQHSVVVSSIAEKLNKSKKDCLKALLHDSHEAYLGDIVTPLKIILNNYSEIENNIDDAISNKFNVIKGMPKWLHRLDKIALATEFRDLRGIHGLIKHDTMENLLTPVEDIIVPLGPDQAALLFLQKYLQYTS